MIAISVAAAGLLFWRGTKEAFNLPRATAMWTIALIVVVVIAGAVAFRGRVRIPSNATVIAGGLFAAALLVATVAAGDRVEAVLGSYARYNGAASYLAYLVLFVAVQIAYDSASLYRLAQVSTVVLGLVGLYGFTQVAGFDFVGWPPDAGEPRFSTLGQTNFAAGYVGICLPVSLAVLACRSSTRRWVVVGAAVSVLAVTYSVATRAFQGPVTIAVGVAFFLIVAARAWPAWRRLPRWAWAAGLLVGLLALGIGAASAPAGSLDGLDERSMLWRAALTMSGDEPIFGSGVASYAASFAEARPTKHAIEYGIALADSAHNVLLDLLVGGGLLLALAYLAFVIAVGSRLFAALRTAEGDRRLLLAGFGGGWLAYQVQSMVSIDVPPLALHHFVWGAAIVVLSSQQAPRAIVTPARPMVGYRAAFAGIVAVAVLTLLPLTRPLRADMAAHRSAEAFRSGDTAVAIRELDNATDLAPWEGAYWADKVGLMQQLRRPADAILAGATAAEESPGAVGYRLGTAQLAAAVGDEKTAWLWFDEAVESDPEDPAVLLPAGRYALSVGRTEEAVNLLERLNNIRPGHNDLLLYLAAAYLKDGRIQAASEVYEEVLSRDPSNLEARNGLRGIGDR